MKDKLSFTFNGKECTVLTMMGNDRDGTFDLIAKSDDDIIVFRNCWPLKFSVGEPSNTDSVVIDMTVQYPLPTSQSNLGS
jgi:hypothetical protein